jgi:hypothetical protein
MLRFVPLTSRARPHEFLHQTTHVGKMKVTAEVVKRAMDALVSILMDGLHDLLQ